MRSSASNTEGSTPARAKRWASVLSTRPFGIATTSSGGGGGGGGDATRERGAALFGAAFFGAAFFGAAFLGAAFFGAAFLGAAFFGVAFFGAAFLGAALLVLRALAIALDPFHVGAEARELALDALVAAIDVVHA